MRRLTVRTGLWTLLVLVMPISPAAAQSPDTFLDPGARDLLARARTFRDAADSSILSYTGTVRSRMAVGLRMPLKDRTLYRRESTARIRWSRDATPIIKAIAFREQTPAGVSVPGMGNAASLDELFDPTQDRIYFGLTDNANGDDDVWIQHPLVVGAEGFYRYKSGDTMTIKMLDGRTVRAIELRVTPKATSGHLVSGSLWIDAANGTVVQALYRLSRPMDVASEVLDEDDRADMKHVPGMFKPMVFDISLVAMEYSLYDLRYWMPRVTRLEGYLRAGVIRTPASYEISYEIDDVVTATPSTVAVESQVTDSVQSAWLGGDYYMGVRNSNGRNVRMLMPVDSTILLKSPELPPPIWKKTSDFVTDGELGDMYDRLAKVAPVMPIQALPPTIVWGSGASDLLRYNRVEALSIGARALYPTPFVELSATARIGLADLHPNLTLTAARSTQKRTLTLRLRHALAGMDDQNDPFGMGNSASALLFGRDDGEYYRVTGAALTLSPAETSRAHSDLTFFAQHDDAVKRETNLSLRKAWDGDFRFRPNAVAAKTELAGATLTFRPWWGSDPFRIQAGLDGMIEGATGGYTFGRARLTGRSAMPLVKKYRIGLEAGAGTAEGDVPTQRLWYIGGANTLRGYDGSSLVGTSFARARADLARTFGWGGLTIFADAGWAGDRKQYDAGDILYSAGVGSSLLDGLLRADLARQLNRGKKWRLELYVDALL
jgi:hypothetical protein